MKAKKHVWVIAALALLTALVTSSHSAPASTPILTAVAASQGSGDHQNAPCGDQARSFRDLMASFDKGRVPSPADVSGTWVLVGLWLDKNSTPDLNCKGLNRETYRGTTLEWVMIAKGYSIEFDAIGIDPQMTSLEPDQKGSLTFSIGWGGESSPVFRCRLVASGSLVCSGSTYYQGVEFKKLPVNEDQLARPKPTP